MVCFVAVDPYSVDIAAAEEFSFHRLPSGFVAFSPDLALPEGSGGDPDTGGSNVVATVVPAPPGVAAMHAEQSRPRPAWALLRRVGEDGGEEEEEHSGGENDLYGVRKVVRLAGGQRREVISASKRKKFDFESGVKEQQEKRPRLLHPDELSAPARNERVEKRGKEEEEDGSRVRTSVTKSVQMVVGNVQVSEGGGSEWEDEDEDVETTGNPFLLGRVEAGSDENDAGDQLRPEPDEVLPVVRHFSREVESGEGTASAPATKRRRKVVRRKPGRQLSDVLREMPPVGRWVPITTTAATATTTTSTPFLSSSRPLPVRLAPPSQQLLPLVTPPPTGATLLRSQGGRGNSDNSNTNPTLGSLLVTDPYYTDQEEKEEELQRIRGAEYYEPKLIPDLVPPPSPPPPFSPSPSADPTRTTPVPRKVSEGPSITFLPPISDSYFDFPSEKPVFYSGRGEFPGLVGELEGDIARNTLGFDLARVKDDESAEDGREGLDYEAYDYEGPNYRPPIKDLSRGYRRGHRQGHQQREEQERRKRERERKFKVIRDHRGEEGHSAERVDVADTYTAPGPPYGVAPAKFAVVSPPPSVPPPPTSKPTSTSAVLESSGFLPTKLPTATTTTSSSPASSQPTFFPPVPNVEVPRIDFAAKEEEGGGPSPPTYAFSFSSRPDGHLPGDGRQDHSSLYANDVYSQQNFAQLRPFFPSDSIFPSPESVRVPRIDRHGFPEILRHISTYSRSSPFHSSSSSEEAAQESLRKPRRRGGGHYHLVDHSPEVVDFGGATGGNGAFGWYSDHPVDITW